METIMKRFFLISMIAAFAGLCAEDVYFAENDYYQENEIAAPPKEEMPVDNNRTKYVRLGLVGVPSNSTYIMAPYATLGWLFRDDNTGIDYSINYGMIEHHHKSVIHFAAPKMQFISFMNPVIKHSFFVGVGGSIGGNFSDNSKFVGLLANLSLGYTIQSEGKPKNYTHFICLGGGMPTIPFVKKGNVYKPSFDLTAGLGF